LLNRAHGATRGAAGIVWRQAGSDVLVDQPLQVIAQFLGEFVFDAATPKQRAKAQTKLSGPAHDRRLLKRA
jgi:hypothetical protein